MLAGSQKIVNTVLSGLFFCVIQLGGEKNKGFIYYSDYFGVGSFGFTDFGGGNKRGYFIFKPER